MKKKLSFSLLIVGILAIITTMYVFAGASFDYGTLAPITEGEDPPAIGEANWTAWWLIYPEGHAQAGTPYEILTEDNTNADDGEDIGYSPFLDPDTVIWLLQIENFLNDPDYVNLPFEEGDPVYMMFGGLGAYSGNLWEYTIDGWIITESLTNHDEVSGPFSGDACPILYDPIDVEGDTTYSFFGAPGTYHVYRSQNSSGADNGASNGQYFWIDTVLTDSVGNGSFVDNTTEESWYVVIQADPDTNDIIGCHSEPVDPTNVRMLGFTAEFQGSSVLVEWETAEETTIIGFDIYRGTNKNFNDSEKLNTEGIIPVENPGSLEGHSYSYTDDDIEPFTTYYYWVEIIGLDSTRDSIGPAAVRTFYELFVPFVLN